METLTRIYVPLSDIERKALIQLGLIEKRDPRAQAAILIRCELERLGWLPSANIRHSEARESQGEPSRS